MSLMQPYRNSEGRLLAGAAPEAAALGDFFETDVGENPHVCGEIREALEAVVSEYDAGGEVREREIYGNLYTLRITPGGAAILNLYDDEAEGFALSLDELRALLDTWCSQF